MPRIIAVIEWAGDEGRAPTVIIGSGPLVRRGVICELLDGGLRQYPREFFADAPHFTEEHPLPDDWQRDDDAVIEWLAAMREATTVPWVSFYDPAPFGKKADDTGTQYMEIP